LLTAKNERDNIKYLSMKVLLVNPNRYRFPPVPPVGLEHVSAYLASNGHTAEVVDLCFSESMYEVLDNAIEAFSPDIAGITVRNIDSVLYHTNEFFLDEIRDVVRHIKVRCGIPVVIGGSGISTNPPGVMLYIEADYAIEGPAEDSLIACLNEIEKPFQAKRAFCEVKTGTIICPRRTDEINYGKYLNTGVIAGF
jgi:radical SAM superfamily enzyme YgiQ (UPF0313 family)